MRRTRPRADSSLCNRCSSRLTLVGCHLPPCAVGIALSSRAMALMETKPAFRSLAIVEANALARTSAACFFACPLLILASLPHVIRPKRVSIRVTVVRCHLPPFAVGIPLRLSSPASDRREMKPAALSSRRVEAKALARESAACLLANAPCIPRRRDISACSRSIGPSWLALDVRLGGKNVADVIGSVKIDNNVAGIRAPAQGKPLLMPLSPTRSSRAGYSRQATRRTAFTSRMMATRCAEAERRRPRSPGRHLLNQ